MYQSTKEPRRRRRSITLVCVAAGMVLILLLEQCQVAKAITEPNREPKEKESVESTETNLLLILFYFTYIVPVIPACLFSYFIFIACLLLSVYLIFSTSTSSNVKPS